MSEEQLRAFAQAVEAAAGRSDLAGPISAIYQTVADAVTLQQPRCDVSGRCCQFDEFGHSLFVTTAEAAYFLAGLPTNQMHGEEPCPYQIDGRCSTHAIRPFGCRVFYCDPHAESWQQSLYATMHCHLRALHERLGIPYFYVEWRQALAALRSPIATPDRAESKMSQSKVCFDSP